jgi:hypothetical protein
MLELSFLSSINYIPVIVSSIIFFLIGSFWFSGLFGSLWIKELKHHHVVIKEPTTNVLATKMLLTFASNFIASFAMACLVAITGSATATTGLILGIIAAFGFAASSIGSVFIWESKSLTLFLIDAGYPMVGIIAAAIILSVWH